MSWNDLKVTWYGHSEYLSRCISKSVPSLLTLLFIYIASFICIIWKKKSALFVNLAKRVPIWIYTVFAMCAIEPFNNSKHVWVMFDSSISFLQFHKSMYHLMIHWEKYSITFYRAINFMICFVAIYWLNHGLGYR